MNQIEVGFRMSLEIMRFSGALHYVSCILCLSLTLIPAEKLFQDIALHGESSAKFGAFAQKFWAQLPTVRYAACTESKLLRLTQLRRSKFPKDFALCAASLELRMNRSIEEAISRRKALRSEMRSKTDWRTTHDPPAKTPLKTRFC